VGAESFHAGGRAGGRTDRQTDIRKLVVDFHNFAEKLKVQRAVLPAAYS
jgi:hypothetical protein